MSILLAIKELQLKPWLDIPLPISVILEDVEKREIFFFFALLGMYISAATVENSVEISLKTRDEIAIWSSSTTTGYTPERDELVGWKRHLY